MSSSAPLSALLELPPELRNRIYSFVFSDTVAVTTSHRLPAILKTCRQTHSEALKLYYASTTFHLSATNTAWLESLPSSHLTLIPTIRFSTPGHIAYLDRMAPRIEGKGVNDSVFLELLCLGGHDSIAMNVMGLPRLLARIDCLNDEQIEVPWLQEGKAKEWVWKSFDKVDEEHYNWLNKEA